MPRPIAGKRKQKIAASAPPVEGVRLTRYDYAAALVKDKAIKDGAVLTPDRCFDMDVVLAKPLQVSVTMRMSYAAELLRKLRRAKKPRRGECHQISVDCPVEIVVDGAMLGAMIDKLESEIEGGAS